MHQYKVKKPIKIRKYKGEIPCGVMSYSSEGVDQGNWLASGGALVVECLSHTLGQVMLVTHQSG